MLADISTGIHTDAQVLMKDREIYHIKGDGNWWWTKSVNRAIEVALRNGAELILTQNNDVELPPDYLERMMEAHLLNRMRLSRHPYLI